MEPIGCIETSVRNNLYSLRNNQEEGSSVSKPDFILICQFTRQKKVACLNTKQIIVILFCLDWHISHSSSVSWQFISHHRFHALDKHNMGEERHTVNLKSAAANVGHTFCGWMNATSRGRWIEMDIYLDYVTGISSNAIQFIGNEYQSKAN
jgi:hypothetical protein